MTHQERDAALANEWHRLMDDIQVPRSAKTEAALARLMSAYSEPHRYYHNLDHIFWMLNLIALREKADPTLQTAIIRLATWYHDVVYDTLSTENESRSWDVAAEAMTELGFHWGMPNPDFPENLCAIDQVGLLIQATSGHHHGGGWKEGDLFLDADLSILGTDPKTYADYAAAIRKEYSWVAEYDYCHGRRKVLKGFLDREKIFCNDWPDYYTEKQARANIAAEIAQIDEQLRTMPS
jgi:predicted metal-dependent HD superfamily phosphohydrolase